MDERSHAFLAERKWIVRTQHHSVAPHCSNEKLECLLIEHCGINVEPVDVATGREFADSVSNGMVMPRILQSSQTKSKASATVGEADTKCSRQLVKSSTQNHRHDGKVGLSRHPYRPRHHVVRHAVAAQHVPGMNQHSSAFIGTVMQEGHDAGIVQIFLADMASDLH